MCHCWVAGFCLPLPTLFSVGGLLVLPLSGSACPIPTYSFSPPCLTGAQTQVPPAAGAIRTL